MNLTLFLYGLKSSRGGAIAWGVFLFLYALLIVYLFHQLRDVADVLAEYMEKMGSMVEVFAGEVGSIIDSEGNLSLGKWMSLEFLSLWPLLMSVYAVFFAGGIAAREVERGTMDMLLSQPVPRRQVIVSRFLVLPMGILSVAVASILGVLIGMALIGTFSDLGGICLTFLPAVLIPLAVGSYSLLFSCIFLDPRKALLSAGSLTGFFYVLHVLAQAVDPLEWVGNLSIFHYYAPAEIASGMNVNWAGIGLYAGIIIACFAASLYVFQRRDIAA